MKKYKYILYSITTIAIFNIVNVCSVYAETFDANITIKPSLTLDISSSKISMELNPSSKPFDEQDIVVSVGTNNTHGYKLYVSIDNNTTDLINIADNTKTLPNLTSAYSTDNFPANYWGYRLTQNNTTSSGDYGIFTSGSIISQSDKPVNNITSTLGFASKIDYTKPSGTYELTLNFKALPIVTQYYMQNLDPSACTEDPTVVIDKRDNQTYTISRLKDGNCWMTQNLKLGKYSDSLTLTQEDSNVSASGFVLNGKLTNDVFPKNGYIYDSSAYYCTETYGCYYNFWAATAGSGGSSVATGDLNYTICPAGWTLPTGGSGGELEKLANAYGGTGADAALAMLVSPTSTTENINGVSIPGLTLGGAYTDVSGGNNIGDRGAYWSRTVYSANAGNGIWLNTSQVSPAIYAQKYYGRSVRCLMIES